ncbi:MAG: tRNA pseudouridine(38-40) synthase TruA [Clostridiales bacterium]|nr:tRNA pseudouridine(38-40) synthase TruA [Clostridiales bacterium]
MDKPLLVSHHRPSAADHPPEGQRRFRLTIEYDGTAYCGWQRQINGPSVQETLEQALCTLTQERVSVTGSSRTDAGVHALGLCAHFDSATRIPAQKLAFALNTLLPPDIRVRESSLAPEGFHARYSACGKLYRYAFYNARHDCAIGRQYAAHIPLPMDERLMDEEAQALLGTHDFAAFAASGSVAKSTVRTIAGARVTREGERVTLCVMGDGFLYNMVRIIAGTLAEIGTGKRAPGAIARAIETGDRLALGQTAPARGLTLVRVFYEGDEIKPLPARDEA